MDYQLKLKNSSILSLFIYYTFPTIIGMCMTSLINIFSKIIVGKGIGSYGLSAIAVSIPVLLINMSFCMLISQGAASMISLRLGKGKRERACQVASTALLMLIITSVVCTFITFTLLDKILYSFGASNAVFPYAKQFLRIVLSGIIFQNIGSGLNFLIRAEGNPNFSMITMVLSTLVSTFLSFIFIMIFNLGIEGCAIATFITDFLCFLWVSSYYLRNKSLFSKKLLKFSIEFRIIKKIAFLGFAPFFNRIAASIITVIINKKLLEYGGDTAIAAMTVVNSVLMFIIMPVLGIAQGIQPIVGYSYGAKKLRRTRLTLFTAIFIATLLTTIGYIITRMFPRDLVKIFSNNDEKLISVGIEGLKIYFLALPLLGIQLVAVSYFQAIGKYKESIFLSFSHRLILLILIFILPAFMGYQGIWYSEPVSDFINFLMVGALLLFIKT